MVSKQVDALIQCVLKHNLFYQKGVFSAGNEKLFHFSKLKKGLSNFQRAMSLLNGTELVKTNNAGKSTFFPDAWDEARVLDEVEYAIANNCRLDLSPGAASNEYFGFSRDGTVQIHFYLGANGSVNSYFPKKR